MTPIAFALNGTLMLLLLLALAVGLKLERRLRGLRDSQANFAKAALELNAAIARAETGLSDIRTAMTDVEQTLTERVDEARAAVKKLEHAMTRLPAAPAPVAASTAEPVTPPLVSARLGPMPALAPITATGPAPNPEDMAGLPIKDLLARLRGSLPLDAGQSQPSTRASRETAPATEIVRSRARVDDDLFETTNPFPPLRRASVAL